MADSNRLGFNYQRAHVEPNGSEYRRASYPDNLWDSLQGNLTVGSIRHRIEITQWFLA